MDYELDEYESAVLDILREEGRVNPLRVREETGIRKQYVNDALRQLRKTGVVRQVTRGLYEHVPEEDDENDPRDDVDADADRNALKERVAEIERERDELEAQIESALEWAEATLDAIQSVNGDEAEANAQTTVAVLEGADDE